MSKEITMESRRTYQYISPSVEELCSLEVVSLQPGDVILCHISEYMDIESCSAILEEMNKAFPNNTTILCNEHVLKGMTILRNTEKINDIVDIKTDIDVNKMFEEVMKGNSNDFLY